MTSHYATRGDQSSGYHIYSLTAFRCPLAAESRVRSHHRFVRSSPDSGGDFSDSPLDSQSMGSAIFYALDSGRGLCHPGRSPCCWPRLSQGPAITALRAVGRFQGSRFKDLVLQSSVFHIWQLFCLCSAHIARWSRCSLRLLDPEQQ